MQNTPRELSALHSTFIKLPFVFKTIVFFLFLSGCFRKVLLYFTALYVHSRKMEYPVCIFSERKLQPNELPHNIYIQNYSTATATCIVLKKWLFTVTRESLLNSDDIALTFLFWQVMNYEGHAISRGIFLKDFS